MNQHSQNYLLNRKVKIYQPLLGYRASSDAVLLASTVNNVKQNDTVLDVGSGTGAISLCVAMRFKDKNISVTGVELQAELAELANLSAQENSFDFVQFINSDIKNCKLPPCSFAHVISNPPYATDDMPSPKLGKCTAHNFSTVPNLSEWIKFCIKMLRPQGYFYMINRTEALEEIICALSGKLGAIRIIPLCSKAGQEAKRVIVVGKSQSKAPLKLCNPLIVHNENGEYTPEAQAILREGKGLFEVC